MFNVVRSTPGGRMKTTAAKLAALAASMLAVLLLMYSVNLASLMRANELLGSYCDLYWFDTPVGLPLVEWLSALVYDVLLIGGFGLLFCRGRLPALCWVGVYPLFHLAEWHSDLLISLRGQCACLSQCAQAGFAQRICTAVGKTDEYIFAFTLKSCDTFHK